MYLFFAVLVAATVGLVGNLIESVTSGPELETTTTIGVSVETLKANFEDAFETQSQNFVSTVEVLPKVDKAYFSYSSDEETVYLSVSADESTESDRRDLAWETTKAFSVMWTDGFLFPHDVWAGPRWVVQVSSMLLDLSTFQYLYNGISYKCNPGAMPMIFDSLVTKNNFESYCMMSTKSDYE